MAKLTILPKRFEILDVYNPRCSFRINIDVINECFGANRGMYMRACYPDRSFIPGTNRKDRFCAWMPKLYTNASGWKNSISYDGKTIFEVAEDDKQHDWTEETILPLDIIRLVFVKATAKDPYRFVGAFVLDKNKHLDHTYRRIATKVRLIGNPVTHIELLDDG